MLSDLNHVYIYIYIHIYIYIYIYIYEKLHKKLEIVDGPKEILYSTKAQKWSPSDAIEINTD